MSTEVPVAKGEANPAHNLSFWKRLSMRALVGLVSIWSATLRFRFTEEHKAKLMRLREAPTLVVLWHNRLFMAPQLLRSYGASNKMAALVSASQDGAWITTGLNLYGILPIRGSRYRRGREALREMVALRQAGKSVIITPDGSRGPMYEMKPGAALLARETESSVFLLSINYSRAWRLSTWDGFFIPWPFSRVQVDVRQIPAETLMAVESVEAATGILKAEMDAITKD